MTGDGIATDPEKIRAIWDWPTPRTVRDVQSFLGLASYYRRVIQSFADRARPLHRLTETSREFKLTGDCEDAFQDLKSSLQDVMFVFMQMIYVNSNTLFILCFSHASKMATPAHTCTCVTRTTEGALTIL